MTELFGELPILDLELFPVLELANVKVARICRRRILFDRFPDFPHEFKAPASRPITKKVPALRERKFHRPEPSPQQADKQMFARGEKGIGKIEVVAAGVGESASD